MDLKMGAKQSICKDIIIYVLSKNIYSLFQLTLSPFHDRE